MNENFPTQKLPSLGTHSERNSYSYDVSLVETTKRSRVMAMIDDPPTQILPVAPLSGQNRRRWRGTSTIVAVTIFVLLNVGVQFDRRNLDVASDSLYGLKRVQHCETLGTKPDIIYLGSSRTIFSGDAEQVDSWVQSHEGKTILGCNVGVFSSTFSEDYYTLKRLIEDGYAPKIVVETLWEYNLNINSAGGDPANGNSGADLNALNIRQIFNLADLSDVPDLSSQFNHLGKDIMPEFVAGKVVPLYGTRFGLLQKVCGSSQAGPCGVASSLLDKATVQRYATADTWGWVGVTNSSIATQSKALYADHYNHYITIASGISNFQIGGHQPEYLARLSDLAQAHGIKLIFTSPPVHPFLFEYLTNPSDWQTIIDYWQNFAAQHHVPYYDLSRAAGYVDADFIDPQHLNAVGATKYATWLAENVIGPLVQ